MFSRFFVLLILYVVIMIVGTLHLEQDDTRLTGVHIRTLISALQVWIVGVLMSLYIMFKFFIHVVKTDRTSFVLVSVDISNVTRAHLNIFVDRRGLCCGWPAIT